MGGGPTRRSGGYEGVRWGSGSRRGPTPARTVVRQAAFLSLTGQPIGRRQKAARRREGSATTRLSQSRPSGGDRTSGGGRVATASDRLDQVRTTRRPVTAAPPRAAGHSRHGGKSR